ncbi:hypothetical protein D3C78_509450 [compost metagenome]
MKLQQMKLVSNREGSFIIEASLVFPIIFCTLLLLMFFCMYLYQGVVLGQAAIVAAERSAYSWDNSYREPRTGQYEEDKYDSLYWRLSDDGMLSTFFGWYNSDNSSSAARLQLPSEGISESSLPMKKLSSTGKELPQGMGGTMEFSNRMLFRKVTVSLERLVPMVPLERVIGDVTQRTRAEAYVVDPVEWIRTVDLVRYYGAKFKGRDAGGNKMDQQEAGEALKKFGK